MSVSVTLVTALGTVMGAAIDAAAGTPADAPPVPGVPTPAAALLMPLRGETAGAFFLALAAFWAGVSCTISMAGSSVTLAEGGAGLGAGGGD